MKALDHWLERLRIRRALAWVPSGSHVLDVGCADGMLFRLGSGRISSGIGVDLNEPSCWPDGGAFERRTGRFPEVLGPQERFDAVLMLAVVEHCEGEELEVWGRSVSEVLRPGGRLVITTPSPLVDPILRLGTSARLIDGMELDQHHGFDPSSVPGFFAVNGVALERKQRFELGLNNLFVFRRSSC